MRSTHSRMPGRISKSSREVAAIKRRDGIGYKLYHHVRWCLEKAMAPHSSALAWKIPWMEEPGGLQSMGSPRVGHDWATSLSLFTFMHWRRKWQPTPVILQNPRDGGVWWAAVYGVAQSQTRLKGLSSSSSRWSHSSFIFKHSFNPHVVPIEPVLPVRFCGNPRQTTATKDTLLPSKKEKEIRTHIPKQQSRVY